MIFANCLSPIEPLCRALKDRGFSVFFELIDDALTQLLSVRIPVPADRPASSKPLQVSVPVSLPLRI